MGSYKSNSVLPYCPALLFSHCYSLLYTVGKLMMKWWQLDASQIFSTRPQPNPTQRKLRYFVADIRHLISVTVRPCLTDEKLPSDWAELANIHIIFRGSRQPQYSLTTDLTVGYT